MSNPMKYIKDLEAAGFERAQAEAQVQMVLDALEGDMVTKTEFQLFQERLHNQLKDLEMRILTKMGLMFVVSSTMIVALLTWLIKV